MLIALVTAALSFSAGWFGAAWFITNGLRHDIRRLDQERQELDDEREALHIAWTTSALSTTEPRVAFDLRAHKRVRVS